MQSSPETVDVQGKPAREYVKSAVWRGAFKEGFVHKPIQVLSLVLKKKYFDIMRSGEKKCEYRDNSMYWRARMRHRHSGAWRRFQFVDFYCGYQRGRQHFRAVCKGFNVINRVSQCYSNGVHVRYPYKKGGYIRIRLGQIVRGPLIP